MRDFNLKFRRAGWKDFIQWLLYFAAGSLFVIVTLSMTFDILNYAVRPTEERWSHILDLMMFGLGIFIGAWAVGARAYFEALDRKVRKA